MEEHFKTDYQESPLIGEIVIPRSASNEKRREVRRLIGLLKANGEGGGPGRAVTVTSHISMFSGACVYFYIIYIIMHNNLLELGKLKPFETIPIFLMAFVNVLLFVNNFLFTYGIYDYSTQLIILNVGILLFFVSMLSLVLEYIIENPPHFKSPSLYKEIYHELDELSETHVLKSTMDEKKKESVELNLIREAILKLNGINILILMYILREKSVIAKDIEEEFNIKKATVSYNIKLLEEYNFIERSSNIEKILQEGRSVEKTEVDQRKKYIIINENGKDFLRSLHHNLEGNI